MKPERNVICAFCFKDLLNISLLGLKLLPPWTGSGAVTSHFERMEVELTAMQAATAHLGGHPTQGAAFFKLSNSTPRQQLLLLAPNTCTQSLGQEPHTLLRKPHSTNNPFQLDSASLVVLPNTKNPTATPFSSDARRHCCKISLAPLEGLFPIPILNPLMVIKGFF